VLVVDDSAAARSAVRALLESRGYEVELASSGEEAFEACFRRAFDVVVSDLTMGALGGVQLTRLLRSSTATADLPVVMLTATGDRRSRFWARNAGADAYVAKDEMSEALPDAVARVVRKGRRTLPAGRAPRPLERLSALLDDLLFAAVLTTDVHHMIEHVDDRRALAQNLIEVAGEVIDAEYVLAVTLGAEGAHHSVLVRGPWDDGDVVGSLRALGVDDARRADVVVVPNESTPGRVMPGEVSRHIIEIGDQKIAELSAYSGRRRLAQRDRETLALIARESTVVLKAATLAEHNRALARTDVLTQVANRRATVERLDHEVTRAKRGSGSLAIALCDVDHFKSVNDKYGHAVGDEVLKAIAQRLHKTIRTIDLVGRWGGEEFLVVLTDATEPGARIAAERLRLAVAGIPPVPQGPPKVSISLGVAEWAGESIEALVERADRALYRAKSRGRDRVEIEPKEAREATGKHKL
jgi:two-component system, cell cycle response regulator